ncbi:hypothetical protein MUN46_004790 [Mesosutterella sp. AGMB02718]|uniref:Transposase n=1 Tax=Mesosutterella faecium TaxID=2925194 RepID=A0ABT7ILM1_9BURK|nr:hypothetical protein [Mesosutterella sp. AGMB02718]MDL2059249.1 hypothetical protein [Mesosutterella sp. AGMB02718]
MNTETQHRKRGRPSMYSPVLAAVIVARISAGESERQICSSEGMPSVQTLNAWKNKHEDFLADTIKARKKASMQYDKRRAALLDRFMAVSKDIYASGRAIPDELTKTYKEDIQRLAREAGLRDDRRFSQRKRIEGCAGQLEEEKAAARKAARKEVERMEEAETFLKAAKWKRMNSWRWR